jgi:hypothetical protein
MSGRKAGCRCKDGFEKCLCWGRKRWRFRLAVGKMLSRGTSQENEGVQVEGMYWSESDTQRLA